MQLDANNVSNISEFLFNKQILLDTKSGIGAGQESARSGRICRA